MPPRMTTDSGATSLEDCFCVAGYNLTDSNTCEECPADVYCTRGDVYECPGNRWTNGAIVQDDLEDCFCKPGTYQNLQGNCEVCQSTKYCPGDNLARVCSLANQVPDDNREMCVCDKGFESKEMLVSNASPIISKMKREMSSVSCVKRAMWGIMFPESVNRPPM